MQDSYLVHIVDDDAAVRDAVGRLVESVGLRSLGYVSAEEFIQTFNEESPSVILLDVRMSGMDGLELQDWLIENSHNIPIVLISGHGDIPMAVDAIQKGAVNFIEKPFRNQTLLDCIRKAIKLDKLSREEDSRKIEIEKSYAHLTDREKEVCKYFLEGMQTKSIAKHMDISHRTIEGYRSNILKKMNAKSSQELLINLMLIKNNIINAL